MTAMLWKMGSEERLREHVIQQDRKFQSVMRSYLGMPEPEKKKPRRLALVKVATSPEAVKRDVIDIARHTDLLRQAIPWKRIIEEVCIAHQVSRAELTGAQRERRIVAARHEAMYRMKTETTMSLPQIGQRLGGKDHSTVLHAVRKYQAKMEAAGL